MSVLKNLKGLLLNELKHTHPEVRQSILTVMDRIDGDLDIQGYDHASDIDDALYDLYNVLAKVNYDGDEPLEEEGSQPQQKERPKLREIDRSDRDEQEV